MSMSIKTRDRLAMEMAEELRSYGLKVILQEHCSGEYARRYLRAFMRDHDLKGKESYFWASTRLFEIIVVHARTQGIDIAPSLRTGWVEIPSLAVAANEIDAIMTERLTSGRPISLLPATVVHLKNAVRKFPANSTTVPFDVTLWLLTRYVRGFGRPVRLVLRPGRIRLMNLRWRSVAAVLVPRKLRI